MRTTLQSQQKQNLQKRISKKTRDHNISSYLIVQGKEVFTLHCIEEGIQYQLFGICGKIKHPLVMDAEFDPIQAGTAVIVFALVIPTRRSILQHYGLVIIATVY